MGNDMPIASTLRTLQEEHPSFDELTGFLHSTDAAVVFATLVHLDARIRAGEPWSEWPWTLPEDLFGLAPEAQRLLAGLSIDGLGDSTWGAWSAPPSLPPSVRLAWLRAALLREPSGLAARADAPLTWEAVKALPCERVIATGLLSALVQSSTPNVREAAVPYLKQAVARGLLSRDEAHAYAIPLARDPSPPIAVQALTFLGEAWAFGLPLPSLAVPLHEADASVGAAFVHALAAQRALPALRRALAGEASASRVCDLLSALGECGDAADVAAIFSRIEGDPHLFGAPGVRALRSLKRRGVTIGDDEARALFEMGVACPFLELENVAEVVGSRSDLIVRELDASSYGEAEWESAVAILEALGTRRAIERLRKVLDRAEDRAGLRHAIRALGRLGVTEAEGAVLAHLDEAPEACFDALREIGGAATVADLHHRLEGEPTPVWANDAATLVFPLSPSASLFALLAERGLVTSEILDAIASNGLVCGSDAFLEIVLRPGNPLRLVAIRTLGTKGGPLAMGLLGDALSDTDEAVRDAAAAALETLGARLRAENSKRPACLMGASNPGAILVADVALRRLRSRSLAVETVAHLLDRVEGQRHPRLVPIVRPYLRSHDAGTRKRAIACLASAGPEAASWLVPWASEADITVARQALLALGTTGASGVAETVAPWLDSRNMNMKKTAADVLARIGDRSSISKLLYWLGAHDNVGFRALLVTALKTITGTWFVATVVDGVARTRDLRTQSLLLRALDGALSATDVAALVKRRGPSGSTPGAHWTGELLRQLTEREVALATGSIPSLYSELRLRGFTSPLVADATTAERARSLAQEAGASLRRLLRSDSPSADQSVRLTAYLYKANVVGQIDLPTLSTGEIHRLLDAYEALDDEAKSGARKVLSRCSLDDVARFRLRAIERARAPGEHVLPASERALLVDDAIDLGAAPAADAGRTVSALVRRGDAASAFAWSARNGALGALARALVAERGPTTAVAEIQIWIDARPELAPEILETLLATGAAGEELLAHIAVSDAFDLGLRARVVDELGKREAKRRSYRHRSLFLALLLAPHASLRERAALALLPQSDREARARIVDALLRGDFRESFTIPLRHGDLPRLTHAVRETRGAARLRLVRIVTSLRDAQQIPLLLELWSTSEPDVRAASRDALRSLDTARVVPHVAADLLRGDLARLDVIGNLPSLPTSLVVAFAAATDRAPWIRFFERVTAGGGIHGPGLAAALIEGVGVGEDRAATARLLVRLDDWADPARVPVLVEAMAPSLSGVAREEALRGIVEATAPLPRVARITVLLALGRATDAPIRDALLDALLDDASLRPLVSPSMLAAVERELPVAAAGEPERAREALRSLAARAETSAQRDELLATLEQALSHRSPRVRLAAHRLLRDHADRERYLTATRALLSDRDGGIVRSAIRALAHGGDLASVGALSALLSHANGAVKRVAHDGLVVLGEGALPALAHASSHARPDRRAAIARVVHEIAPQAGEPST